MIGRISTFFALLMVVAGPAPAQSASESAAEKTQTDSAIRSVRVVDADGRALLISETEITQAQWRSLTGTNPAFFPACGDDCPIEGVSWYEAIAFANLLSQKDGLTACYTADCRGKLGGGCAPGNGHGVSCYGDYSCKTQRIADCTGYRLPNAEEWSFAARGGVDAQTYNGDLTISKVDGRAPELEPIGWYSGNSTADYDGGWNCSQWASKGPNDRCGPHPVALKKPNDYGLYDMLGSMWEWVEDSRGGGAMIRGGAWNVGAVNCRPDAYDFLSREYRSNSVGFRLVRTAAR